MHRRRFLAALAASTAVAGCLGSNDDGDQLDGGTPTDTTTDVPATDTPTATDPTATTTSPDESAGTVTWSFDPLVVEEHGDAVVQSLYDAGLSKDVEVAFHPADQNHDRRRDRYAQLLGGGEAEPDLLHLDHEWVPAFAQRGLLANLTEALDDRTLGAIEAETFDAVETPGRHPATGDLHGVPLYFDAPTIQYRRDQVEAAGFDPAGEDWATEPMSWAEFSRVARAVQEAADVDHGFATQFDVYVGTACCNFAEVLASFGGAYFGGPDTRYGPVGDRPVTVDEEPALRSLAMLRRFVHGDDADLLRREYARDIAPRELLSWREEDVRKAHLSGRVAFMRNWPYAIEIDADPNRLGDAVATMPMPAGVPPSEARYEGTGGSAAAMGAWHAGLNPHSRRPAAAAEVLRILATDEVRLTLFEHTSRLPPTPGLLDTSRAREVEPLGRHVDTFRVAGEHLAPRPATRVWPDQVSLVAEAANAAVAKQHTSQKAMTDLAADLREIEQSA